VQVKQGGKQPIYKITINSGGSDHQGHQLPTSEWRDKIDFRGTPLMPAAHGEAKVESKQGYIESEVEFRNMESATRFGPEFLACVMWTITPEGRAANIGEIILNGTSSKLDVTPGLQAFGLVVTAEPYFGITQPSDVAVMENFVRKDIGVLDHPQLQHPPTTRVCVTRRRIRPAPNCSLPLINCDEQF
jgi:hypothetical protein